MLPAICRDRKGKQVGSNVFCLQVHGDPFVIGITLADKKQDGSVDCVVAL